MLVLHCTNARFDNVVRAVARWYEVKVIFRSTFSDNHITGEIMLNRALNKTLEQLETLQSGNAKLNNQGDSLIKVMAR